MKLKLTILTIAIVALLSMGMGCIGSSTTEMAFAHFCLTEGKIINSTETRVMTVEEVSIFKSDEEQIFVVGTVEETYTVGNTRLRMYMINFADDESYLIHSSLPKEAMVIPTDKTVGIWICESDGIGKGHFAKFGYHYELEKIIILGL